MENLALSDNALSVLQRRYLTKDKDGNITETPQQLFARVAAAVATADANYGGDVNAAATGFYEMMTSLRFLPNSPTLMNAGRPLGQLSACFVLPIEDSMEAIFETIKNAALIHKSGGGTGFSFSRLRPAGDVVNTTGGVASGPVSFMRVFNMATEAVKQGGTRRGANMGILRVDHPDILSFISCKQDNADITNFNISVGITDEFLRALDSGSEYELINPSSKQPVGKLSAREVFANIVDSAWHNGEPGIVFLDRLNRDNVVPALGEIESTNPCGEQPLLPYESCNLGSINLVKMLKTGDDGRAAVDFDLLAATVDEAVHFLDNVIDVNNYPLPQIAQMTRSTRKIGLGVMGFADMLLYLGVPYNSDAAVEFAGKLMEFITAEGRRASQRLAETRGAFPMFANSTLAGGPPVRNATVTTIAPTGTLSILAGCSSGVEPVFAYAFVRNIMDNTQMVEINPVLERVLEAAGLAGDELRHRIAESGTVAHIDEIPQQIRDVFVCAHDVSPEYHIRIQAAFQKYTDNAVSKTVNFPRDATRDDVAKVYLLAEKLGCKGVTIYRDGSRDNQVLNIGALNGGGKKADTAGDEKLTPRERPAVTTGYTERVRTGCGNLYITVNYDDKGICEVFTSTGKGGGCPSQSEATARLMSLALRCGVSPDKILTQLKGIRCPSTMRVQGLSCSSCPDAIARTVAKAEKYRREHAAVAGDTLSDAAPSPVDRRLAAAITEPQPEAPAASESAAEAAGPVCPECGQSVTHEGGCVICHSCGYSKCG